MLKLQAKVYSNSPIQRSYMPEIRIIAACGIKLIFKRGTNYEKKRCWTISLAEGETGERLITDLVTMPEELWKFVGNNIYTQYIEIKRLRPLVLKTETEYKLKTDVLKDYMSTPQVRIDHGVIHFKEVDCLTDACTDALQDRLDQGWSILAIIPQVGQRRPDYVVGRQK